MFSWFDFPTTDGGRLEYAAVLFKLPKSVGRANRILRLKPIPLQVDVQVIDEYVSSRHQVALVGYPEGSYVHTSLGLLEEAYGEGVVKVKHSASSRGGNGGSPLLVWDEETYADFHSLDSRKVLLAHLCSLVYSLL